MSKDVLVHHAADARAEILKSIRAHLDESAHVVAATVHPPPSKVESSSIAFTALQQNGGESADGRSLVETFKKRLESVGGHCILVRTEAELTEALQRVFAELQSAGMLMPQIALSDAPVLQRFAREIEGYANKISIMPGMNELFAFDIGITTAQAAIAETGTLVLESDRERHRLVSLLPPVHIAIVDSKDIYPTLGYAIHQLRRDPRMSPAITFITGPSRTADIELTLTIGVHGPKELYVIINEGSTDFKRGND